MSLLHRVIDGEGIGALGLLGDDGIGAAGHQGRNRALVILDVKLAVGLAKQEELLFTRDRVEGIALRPESAALRLVQRIRDEAHRFAITFHRQSRTRRDLRSAIDDITGIGPKRRRQLLTAFGSFAGVQRASREELERVVGAKAAESVLRHFADRR